jgi:hypothetical protein
MDQDEPANFADWANLAPAGAMALFWLLPIAVFWGIAFGPLSRDRTAAAGTAPPIRAFMAFGILTLAPLALPHAYFVVGNRRRAAKLYRHVGVPAFKRLVVNGDWVTRLTRTRHPDHRPLGGRGELQAFLERTCAVERWHLVLLLMSLLSAGYSVRIGWYRWALGLTLGNVACNVYPILLQRYHRARVRNPGKASACSAAPAR